MSVRARLVATTATVALAAGTATALLPAVANAAAPAPAKPAVTVSYGAVSARGPLLPGGRTESFTVTATNTTGKSAPFLGTFSATPQGVFALASADLSLSVVPVHAPATGFGTIAEEPGLIGQIHPKASKLWGSADFVLPAHASYTWKVTVGATKAWKASDNAVLVNVSNSAAPDDSAPFSTVDLKVGAARTGGRVVETLTGGGSVAPGRDALETLTVANRTGAAVPGPVGGEVSTSGLVQDGDQYGPGRVTVDLLEGGHWVALKGGQLPVLGNGLAKDAVVSYRLRLVSGPYQAPFASGTTPLYAFFSAAQYALDGPTTSRTITVYQH
ncbi:hypothetical protein [Streptacidiphilus sp. P02-A3a]|uniref:hypothetical protein n=1 Tax=Streptacidiphilus sp. P02-A3a TaxID=2704468 RepID=UPI0015F8D4E9|nr:hypothetical protein [Streptacidiphilus sp. P02-A3a]QMU68970.1 hypothetical protein GXP74_12710 [Streptacidiphilus sp. P02-A3a]